MKTLIWKEIRENLKWALLVLAALTGAEFYGLLNRGNNDGLVPLMKPSFLMITTWGCAAAGLLLGLAQTLPEQRRDRWAALLHRPVTRDTILWGKVLAGLALYFISTATPFLLCSWFVKASGQYPILFSPGFMEPGWVDIAGGSIYYFAALFIVLRGGPWYGSRILAIPAELLITSLVSSCLYLTPSLVIIGVVALLFLAAAFGAMRTNGTFGNQPLISRISLAGILLLPIFAGIVMAANFFGSFFPDEVRESFDYWMLKDGRPVIIHQTRSGLEMTDLAGHPLSESWLKSRDPWAHYLNLSRLSTCWDGGNRHPQNPLIGYRGKTGVISLPASRSPGEAWVFMEEKRIIVGFAARQYPRSRKVTLIGSIGADGFHPGSVQARPFPEPWVGRDPRGELFQMGGKVCRFDSVQRQVQTVFDGSQIFGMVVLEGKDARADLVALDLERQILVMDRAGKTRATLPHRRDLQKYGEIMIAHDEARDRYLVQYGPTTWDDPKARSLPTYWDEMDEQGNLLDSYTLPALKNPSRDGSLVRVITSLMPSAVLGTYYAILKVGILLGSEQMKHELADFWNMVGASGWGLPLISIALALVALGLARWRQMTWKSAIGWALFVLGFNLAGLFTFLLIADWPVLVKCPKCGGKRDLSRSTCPRCQSPWPSPEPDGTEIVEAHSEMMSAR